MCTLAVDVRTLTYCYSDGVIALDGVTLAVRPKEAVGIIGPNGAGKTTFFLALAGVLLPQKGQVRLFDLDLSQVADRRRVPGRLGLVFQNGDDQLFSATVLDDVAFGPLNLGVSESETRERVAAALQQVGLSGYESRPPHHLSGGEKRRVALAGVLVMRPDILLLDEPTSHLDPRGRRGLIQLLNSFTTTKFIAAHDLEFILATCDRAVLLDQGRVAADGLVRDVLADRALMERHGLEVPPSLLHGGQKDESAGRHSRPAGSVSFGT